MDLDLSLPVQSDPCPLAYDLSGVHQVLQEGVMN